MRLPIMLLTLFALGILLIDFMLPAEWKWVNAVTAFVGVLFSAAGVVQDSDLAGNAAGVPGMLRTHGGGSLRHLLLVPVPGRRRDRHPDVGSLSRDRDTKTTASSTR